MSHRVVSLLAVAAWMVPLASPAEVLCQHKKSKEIVRMESCPRKYRVVLDLGTVTELAARTTTVEAALESGAAQIEALKTGSTALETRATSLETKAIDLQTKLNGLGPDDLGTSFALPFPAKAIGNHHRLVSADLDMNIGDGAIAVVQPKGAGEWLTFDLADAANGFADFNVKANVFSATPRCVVGLGDLAPNPRTLATSVSTDGTTGEITIRVRLVGGAPNQLDFTATMICVGPAGNA